MPIDTQNLEAVALAYVAGMTSIRGRRVERLLRRELKRFDHVLRVTTEDGASALLALAADGSVAICRTDGRGKAAGLVEWRRLDAAAVTSAYDLLHDSLPLLHWTIAHPSFARVGGALTIMAADYPASEHAAISAALRAVGS